MSTRRVCFGAARVGDATPPETPGALREALLLRARSSPKRSAEFLAGRLAARRALDLFEGREDPSRWVDRDPYGDLHVRHGDGVAEHTYVSITHVEGRATAAASNARIGIDAVVLEPTTRSFADETAHADEHARFREFVVALGLGPAFAPVVLFAAKEAASKWLGIGLRVALPELVVHPVDAAHLAFAVSGERVVAELQLAVSASEPAAPHDARGRALLTLVAPDDPALRSRVRARCTP